MDTDTSSTPTSVEAGNGFSVDRITYLGFKQVLERYNDLIQHLSKHSKPAKSNDGSPSSSSLTLLQLDELRLDSLPAKLQSGDRSSAPFLLGEEVELLLRWKLKHGKFRPRLMELVQMNEPTTVVETTKSAFKIYSDSSDDCLPAIKRLVSLKGIGPATASLLLSVHAPANVPFFSDEGYRWVRFEKGKAKGWDRDIKYNLHEYLAYFNKVKELRERLAKQSGEEIKAVDVEKVGFVLGKEAMGISVPVDGPSREEDKPASLEVRENRAEHETSPPSSQDPSARAQLAQTNQDLAPPNKRKKAPTRSTKDSRSTNDSPTPSRNVENSESDEGRRRSARLKRVKRT